MDMNIEKWLRKNIPTTPLDKTQHQNLAKILIVFVAVASIIVKLHLVGIIWIVAVNLAAIYWERKQFKIDLGESLRDYGMTFKVSFPWVVVLIFLLTSK